MLWAVTILLLPAVTLATNCMECVDVPDPQECTTITTCTAVQKCVVTQYISSGGLILYSSGCLANTLCTDRKRHTYDDISTSMMKRQQSSTDIVTCEECCDGDYCNTQGCGTKAVQMPQRGPICFSCKEQKDPDSCRDVQYCTTGMECALYQHKTGGDQLWGSQCVNEAQCGVLIQYLGRRRQEHDYCARCCKDDFCNRSCRRNITTTTAAPTTPAPTTAAALVPTHPTHKTTQATHKATQATHKATQATHKVTQATHKVTQATHKVTQATHKATQATHKVTQSTHATHAHNHHNTTHAHLTHDHHHSTTKPTHATHDHHHDTPKPTHAAHDHHNATHDHHHGTPKPTHATHEHHPTVSTPAQHASMITTTHTMATLTTSDPAVACRLDGYVYDAPTELCLKAYHTHKNWTDAMAVCQREKGTLAIANTDLKAKEISLLLEKQTGTQTVYWVGANDANSVHAYTWSSGEVFVYDNSTSIDLSNNNCILVSASSSSPFTVDICHNTHAFVCERKKSIKLEP